MVYNLFTHAFVVGFAENFVYKNFSAFLRIEAAKDQIIAVISVIQGTVDAADGGSGRAGFFGDFKICPVLFQHGCHLEALGEGQKLVNGTQILEEIIAFLLRLQAEDGLKKMINSVGFEFFIHSFLHFCAAFVSTLLRRRMNRVCGWQRADTNLAIENFNFQSSSNPYRKE